jgi:hypothetical protein
MKKYILTIASILSLLLVGCEFDEVIYDGSQTLAYFEINSAKLPIPIADMSNTVEIPFSVSTLSDVERTVSIEIDTDATAAQPEMYDVDATATIPAGSYTSSFIVTGFQQGLSQTGDNLVLRLAGVSDGGVGSPATVSVNIVQTCPLDTNVILGTYRGNIFGNDYEVTATEGPEPNTVIFTNIEGRAPLENDLIVEFKEDGTATIRKDLDNLVYTHPRFGPVEPFNLESAVTFNLCTGDIEMVYGACVSIGCFGDRGYQLIKQ